MHQKHSRKLREIGGPWSLVYASQDLCACALPAQEQKRSSVKATLCKRESVHKGLRPVRVRSQAIEAQKVERDLVE